MKKIIIFIILFLLSTLGLSAQYLRKPNTVYVSLQPNELGIGLRYDRILKEKYGVYISITKGSYHYINDTYEMNIDEHYKISSGLSLYVIDPAIHKDYIPFVGVGLNYNTYSDKRVVVDQYSNLTNPVTYNIYSFELGFGARLLSKYNVAIRFDPMKGESSIDFGYSF